MYGKLSKQWCGNVGVYIDRISSSSCFGMSAELKKIAKEFAVMRSWSGRIDLFGLYVEFSQYRSCDNTLGNCFFQISSYSRAYVREIYEKTKGQVPLGPLLGKQNIQAKEVHCWLKLIARICLNVTRRILTAFWGMSAWKNVRSHSETAEYKQVFWTKTLVYVEEVRMLWSWKYFEWIKQTTIEFGSRMMWFIFRSRWVVFTLASNIPPELHNFYIILSVIPEHSVLVKCLYICLYCYFRKP